MKKQSLLFLLGLFFVFTLSGCVVRTYKVTKDRVDQDLTYGNRGYLKGEVPVEEAKERKATRAIQVVEVELHPPIRFEKVPKAKETTLAGTEDKQIWGNRGFITKSSIPEVSKPKELSLSESLVNVEKYRVQKGDTLQKISKRFYGTTRKWNKIYEANRNILKGPDKIYPGQTIDIPLDNPTK